MKGQSTREAIVREVVQLIASRGFDGLSVRTVAANAGVSIGTVQHHFPTKTQMLRAGMDEVSRAASGRYAAIEAMADPAERLHAIVDLLLPGEERDLTARVWLAFAARAGVDDDIGDAYRALWGRVRAGLRLMLQAAASGARSPEHDAAELLALLDGLTMRIISERSREQLSLAREIAHRRVDEMIAGD